MYGASIILTLHSSTAPCILRHRLRQLYYQCVLAMCDRLPGCVERCNAFNLANDCWLCLTGYLDALGHAMLSVCQAIPNGVLCFFPSWGLLNAARDQWLVTGKCITSLCCVSASSANCFALPEHRPLHCHGPDSTCTLASMLYTYCHGICSAEEHFLVIPL